MKIKNKYFLLFISFVFIYSDVFSQPGKDRRPAQEKWDYVQIQAMVQAVDYMKREVILMGPNGNIVTVDVDKNVKRLNEIKVGDVVATEYWTYLMAEFRDPTAEELQIPLIVIEEGGKAPDWTDPSAAVGATIKAVVTIEIINLPAKEVTVKGPRGKYVSVAVEDHKLLRRLNVGEVVMLTYAEAMALSLKKIK